MKFYFQKKVLFGFLAAMSIIAWLAVYSYINNKKYKETSRWVAHTNEVLYHAEQLLSIIIQIESAQRGYTITGDEAFLESYDKASRDIGAHINDLKNLMYENVNQRPHIHQLAILVEEKLAITRKAIEARRQGNEVRQQSAFLEEKRLMDDIRKSIEAIQHEENTLLQQRITVNEEGVQQFNHAFFSLLIATGVILVLVFVSLHINLRARVIAEKSLKNALAQIQDMYDHAPCGYHSVNADGVIEEINQTWLSWLKYDKHEVVSNLKFYDIITAESKQKFPEKFSLFKERGYINGEFEVMRKDGTTFPVLLNATAIYDNNGDFLKSRSTVFDYTEQRRAYEKIKQLNQELEAFSYSVSHDLRAPLRSIDGYTRILSEDYGATMDDEGKRVLAIIINNARKMGQLIDDLLDFSRLGRKEIAKTRLNMDTLVRSVFAEVTETEKQRTIEYKIHPIQSCTADPSLLRQVWTNLISNAVKYTRRQDKAFVEITSTFTPEETIYSIKDNGTGFDMQYVHKLFGVFQRLHRQQDFEGTGVGLAIVHRIITRHGGKVWAEGKEEEGAVFYFSLPNEINS